MQGQTIAVGIIRVGIIACLGLAAIRDCRPRELIGGVIRVGRHIACCVGHRIALIRQLVGRRIDITVGRAGQDGVCAILGHDASLASTIVVAERHADAVRIADPRLAIVGVIAERRLCSTWLGQRVGEVDGIIVVRRGATAIGQGQEVAHGIVGRSDDRATWNGFERLPVVLVIAQGRRASPIDGTGDIACVIVGVLERTAIGVGHRAEAIIGIIAIARLLPIAIGETGHVAESIVDQRLLIQGEGEEDLGQVALGIVDKIEAIAVMKLFSSYELSTRLRKIPKLGATDTLVQFSKPY